jgi:hypothetical protein
VMKKEEGRKSDKESGGREREKEVEGYRKGDIKRGKEEERYAKRDR